MTTNDMKLFLLSLRIDDLDREPWGDTIEMLVRASSETRAREEFLSDQRYGPDL